MDKKGKILYWVSAFLFVLGLTVISVVTYQIFTQEEEPVGVIFNKDNFPRVDASLATQPLMDAMYSSFTGIPLSEVNIEYTNTHPAYVKLINGETDLIIVTEPSEEELELAEEKGVELEVIPVVNEAFVFFVNTDNKVDNLSLEQIQDIYSGKTNNWKDVGGSDAEILAYQRPKNSGSQTGMLSLVMKDIKIKEPLKGEEIVSMAGIIEYVANYENSDKSIGYSYYYYATTMYGNDKIKFIGVNDIKPTYETIQNKTYPLMSAYYIVIRKDEKEDSDVRKLADAMLSRQGQDAAKEAGYVPIK